MTLTVDPEEYPVPSDGDVTEDFEEHLRETLYDLEGVKIMNMKVTME